jgi:hypothetical protein
MICAVMPAWAPSTIVTAGLTMPLRTAALLKTENSIVAFDMPIESRTIFPVAAGVPFAERGVTRPAAANPAWA